MPSTSLSSSVSSLPRSVGGAIAATPTTCEIGRVRRRDLVGPHGRVPALRVAVDGGGVGHRVAEQVAGGTDAVEHRSPLALPHQVRVRARRAEAGVVGEHDGGAGGEEVGHLGDPDQPGVGVVDRRRAPAIDARRAVGPGDDRPAASRRVSGRRDDDARHGDRGPRRIRRRVEDPLGDLAGGQVVDVLAADDRARTARGQLLGRVVERRRLLGLRPPHEDAERHHQRDEHHTRMIRLRHNHRCGFLAVVAAVTRLAPSCRRRPYRPSIAPARSSACRRRSVPAAD